MMTAGSNKTDSPTRPSEASGAELSRICSEMRSWISASFHAPSTIAQDGQQLDAFDPGYEAPSASANGVLPRPQVRVQLPPALDNGMIAPMEKSECSETTRTVKTANASPKPMVESSHDGNTRVKPSGKLKPSNLESSSRTSFNKTNAGEKAERASTQTQSSSLIPPQPLGVIRAALSISSSLTTKEDSSNICGWSVSSVRSGSVVEAPVCVHQSNPLNISHKSKPESHDSELIPHYSPHTSDVPDRNESEVDAWVIKHRTPPQVAISHANLRDINSIHCDVDPEEGRFLPPVVQPYALPPVGAEPYNGFHDISWRRGIMNAALRILKEREQRDRERVTDATKWMQLLRPHPHTREFEVEKWPEASCTIRPAMKCDFAQIADIINAEAESGSPRQIAASSDETTCEDVAAIFARCQAEKRPFIVAIQEDFLDRRKWPKNSENVYEQFVCYMAKKSKAERVILGFAFVDDARCSVNRRFCASSPYLGRLQLIVHPEHRGKRTGSALLDRILLSVSSFHRSTINCDWQCDKPDGIYEFPANRNHQQYTHLYIDVVSKRQDAQSFSWKIKLLKDFEFAKVASFRNAIFAKDEQLHDQWFDMAVWERIITPITQIATGA